MLAQNISLIDTNVFSFFEYLKIIKQIQYTYTLYMNVTVIS